MSNTPQNTGDSDDLEALFDSIVMASQSTEPAAEAKSATAVQMDAVNETSGEACSERVFSSLGHMTRKLHDTLRELGYDTED